jgi:hypothetical protein
MVLSPTPVSSINNGDTITLSALKLNQAIEKILIYIKLIFTDARSSKTHVHTMNKATQAQTNRGEKNEQLKINRHNKQQINRHNKQNPWHKSTEE